MRIAQVSPLYESVPPRFYGGTERVVSYLTEELVRQGHDVTLFASGDSTTSARLIPGCLRSLRLSMNCESDLAHHMLMIEQVAKRANEFDILHFHCDFLHFPISRRLQVPGVTTLHGRLNIPDLYPLYQEFQDIPVVSISNAQRDPLPWANWQGTVYHGIPEDMYTFHSNQGDYLAFLGRISREKRLDRAISIAKKVGMKIKIAAKIDNQDKGYFDDVIKPLLKDKNVEFLGEIREEEKNEFLGNAFALVFPIDWPEPFGLVMIESMACGTPVIAYRRGSVPEIIDDCESGMVVTSIPEAVKAVKQVARISRKRCRQIFEQRFTAARMAEDYLAIYKRVIEVKTELWLQREGDIFG